MGIKKYIYAFIITLLILFLGVYLINTITNKKIETVRSIETDIAINILSAETQFALLSELECKDIAKNTLSSKIAELAKKLESMELNTSTNNSELLQLKKYYFLLEIKDFILMQRIAKKCDENLHYILYFYSNSGNCDECKKQGKEIRHFVRDRKDVRVYSFDYDLKLSATETLKNVYQVNTPLPAVVVDGKVFNKLLKKSDLEDLLPAPEDLTNQTSDNSKKGD